MTRRAGTVLQERKATGDEFRRRKGGKVTAAAKTRKTAGTKVRAKTNGKIAATKITTRKTTATKAKTKTSRKTAATRTTLQKTAKLRSKAATDKSNSVARGRIENGVLWGDCLDVMREMPSDSVDLIVTSPPYADARAHTYGGKKPEEYVDWFCERADQMFRILKPTGSFVLNIKEKAVDGERHTYVLELILAMRQKVGFRWVEEYIWHKTTSAPGRWKYRFRDAWERILHFSKTKDIKMRQEAVKVPIGDWTEKRLKNMSRNDRMRQESATRSGVGRRIEAWDGRNTVFPSNVLHRPPVCHNTGHSAAFPEWLPEFFIRLFTEEGDVVLDPFLGSGTTHRVAERLGRIAVGIELNPETPMEIERPGNAELDFGR